MDDQAASTSQMARFETDVLASTHNREALADLPGQWIVAMHDAQPPKWITLDMCMRSGDLRLKRLFLGCFECTPWAFFRPMQNGVDMCFILRLHF